MLELWVDPWVTQDGSDPMADYEMNCADPILEPTCDEVDTALRSLRSSVLVAKIASKFVRGMHRRSLSGASDGNTTSPPTSTFPPHSPSLLSGSPLSSPLLMATPFTSTPITFAGIAGGRETPLRKETVSSISTLDSVDSAKFDRCESPGSSIGAVAAAESKILYMAEPEEVEMS